MAPILPPFVVLVLAVAFAVMPGCRRPAETGIVEPGLAACLPSDTLAVAGVDLVRLRASSTWRALPPSSAALLETTPGASYALLAYNGKIAFAAVRGGFRQAPAGGVLLAKDLAVFGPPEAVRAAEAQRKTGGTGAGWLLERAGAAAKESPLWAVVRGGATLPLSGNAANFNQLLRLVEYAVLAAKLDSQIELALTAEGRSPEAAQRFEETLRASFSLAAAGMRRSEAPGSLLRSVDVRRDNLTVRATASAAPEELGAILGAFSR
jgi:hypothetical protein